jgi:hypothetical protein
VGLPAISLIGFLLVAPLDYGYGQKITEPLGSLFASLITLSIGLGVRINVDPPEASFDVVAHHASALRIVQQTNSGEHPVDVTANFEQQLQCDRLHRARKGGQGIQDHGSTEAEDTRWHIARDADDKDR